MRGICSRRGRESAGATNKVENIRGRVGRGEQRSQNRNGGNGSGRK